MQPTNKTGLLVELVEVDEANKETVVWSSSLSNQLEKRMAALISRLPKRHYWTAHHMVGHPLSEVFFQLGFEKLGNKANNYFDV